MKKLCCTILLLAFSLILCSCGNPTSDATLSPTPSVPPTQEAPSPAPTGQVESPPPTEQTPVPTEQIPEPTEPPHSELYLPGYDVSDITEYFEEVVLNIEYSDGTGSPNLVQKWLSPLYYRIYGTPTDTDKEVLLAFTEQLNAIPGFPGIYPTEDGMLENVSISFLDADVFNDSFYEVIQGEYAFGAAQFWYYTDTNELHTARIGCRTDIDQTARNSVLPEEIVNILGISDTVLRPDSLTYQYSNDNTALSDIDLVILTLLYHPSVQCGMDAESCTAIIRELYY